ncbi:MAG: DUF2862 domain-containing protein [Thermosynechococcaceae cyanobacterium]
MRIGQRVRISRIIDGARGKASDKVGQMGMVTDYKMTDGSGIGVVVTFSDNTSSWFFEDELEGRR